MHEDDLLTFGLLVGALESVSQLSAAEAIKADVVGQAGILLQVQLPYLATHGNAGCIHLPILQLMAMLAESTCLLATHGNAG